MSVEGTEIGTATNERGRFRLSNVPAGSQTLLVSFVGYEQAEVPVDVEAGATATRDISLSSEVLSGGEVIVAGIRSQQLQSLARERQALNLVEVLSADAIGTLPDQNVAEAVRRVSGVTIQTDRGEGRFVSIRGIEPSLSNVTLNGHSLASSAASRATALDLLPAAMVSSIEVTKAVTPDMDGNAVGGTIDINTLTAFDRNGPFVLGSANGLFHDQQVNYGDRKTPYRANVTAGLQFGPDDDWGFVLSGNASRRDYTASVVNPTDWVPMNDYYAPETFENEVQETERNRYAVNANLDYRPTNTTNLYLRTNYSRTEEFDDTAEYQFDLAEGDISNQTATSGRFSAGASGIDLDVTEETEYLLSATLGGEQRFGDVTWMASGTYTRGLYDRYTRKPEFTTGEREDLASSFDASGKSFQLTFEDPDAVSNPENYLFNELDLEFESNIEDTWVASTDLRWDTELGSNPSFFKVGGKFRSRSKVIDDLEQGYVGGTDPANLARESLTPPTLPQGGSVLPVLGDTEAFANFFDENQDNPRYFDLDESESEVEGVENDSNNGEDVYAGYAMGSTEIGPLTVLAGARVEATQTESTRYQLLVNDGTGEQDVSSETFDNSYVDVLPSVHLKYTPIGDVVLRASWTNTIGRPDYEELSGFREVEFSEDPENPGVFEGGISEGNPDLEPFEAMNFDVAGAYYIPSGGVISLGGFHKRIDNPIYEYEITDRDVNRTLGGQERFFEEISYTQDRNANSGTVSGIEASYEQLLTFLPSPLDGLGLTANAAAITSSVDVPGRESDDLPFFNQSDLVYNLIPYYQRAGFELRMAMSYQGEYLLEVGEEPYLDVYQDDRLTLDLTGSYKFWEDNLEVKAQVRNLTNEEERAYQGVEERYIENILTGRTFTLGVSVNL